MTQVHGAQYRQPVLDKDVDTNEWVLKVDCAPWVRIPGEQRALAYKIFNAATRAYHNGCEDLSANIRRCLGITS
jgi:hypothetical protein